jgi:hypothetical protein
VPKLYERTTLEAGIHDAPLSVIKNVKEYKAFAIQLGFLAGSTTSECYLEASCDYDPETGSGNWSTVSGSTQILDETDSGIHIWNVTEFHAPYLRITVTGNVEEIYLTFIGQPNQARLS